LANKKTTYGYARVSTKKQDCDQVFAEAVSGADKKKASIDQVVGDNETGRPSGCNWH